MKKYFLGFVIMAFVLSSGFFLVQDASCKPIELKMSHFMPTKHTQHKVMAAWAEKIGAATNGRIKITIYPGGMLGKPPHQYDGAKKGITDIAFGLQSYTAGRFPLTSAMRLPFLSKSGKQASKVLWNMYGKYLYKEYPDTKLLWIFAHGPGQIFTTKKPIKTIADMKGMKFRTPGAIMSKALKALGAVPVTMPITQVYTALERGTIDGVVGPWEITRPFRLYEQCKYATELDMYTATFFVTMNKQKYESLPADLKKIFDANIGQEMCEFAGEAYDKADAPSKELAVKKGMQVYKLPDSELAKFKQTVAPIREDWIKDKAAAGLPAQKVMNYMLKQLKKTQ